MTSRLFSCLFLLAALSLHFIGSTETGIAQDEASRGEKLYIAQCSGCHGIDRSGGRGPALNQPWLLRQANGRYFFNTIRAGLEGGEMPAFPMISDTDIWEMIQYIRSKGSARQVSLPGDPAAGKMIYSSKGACTTCHILDGEGTAAGPELTGIGGRRSIAFLRDALINPGKDLPEGYQIVTLVFSDRKTIRGVRINEDTFTIQIRDLAGNFHSHRKDRLVEIKREASNSTMPAYGKTLTETEINDLVAYLASLREQR